MIRRFAFAALLLGAVACGDDSDDPKPAETGKDAGTDAAVVLMTKVDNTGAACMANSDCTGSTSATCLKQSPTVALPIPGLPPAVAYPGGFCSATCTSDVECKGTGAVCPLSQITSLLPQAGALLGNLSTCMVKCAAASDCRVADGWRCVAANVAIPQLGMLLGGGDAGAAGDGGAATGGLSQTYCFPPAAEVPDAGATDAGATDAGATDAGATDAGATDAGATDGGADAATNDM
jgi:hypothetical protein